MPLNGSTTGGDKNAAGRTTFRPPWVKEGSAASTPATGTKTAPWRKTGDTSDAGKSKENGAVKEVKLQSREIKVPVMTERKKSVPEPIKQLDRLQKPQKEEPKIIKDTKPQIEMPKLRKVVREEKKITASDDEDDESKIIKPQLRKVIKETKKVSIDEPDGEQKLVKPQLRKVLKDRKESVEIEPTERAGKFAKPVLKKVPKVDEAKPPPEPEEKKLALPALKPVPKEVLQRQESIKHVPQAPPMPVLKPVPPPPPPPPGLKPPDNFVKKPVSNKQLEYVEKLKRTPRRRPDWSEMMKEVESGRKLKHVECNDRSKPIITCKSMTKVNDQFVYETEKPNVHNKLLQQIQGGIRLKPTVTNDRSKPILEGLRKFRKQMTIEEQIQKSESKAQLNFEVVEDDEPSDEMDDIDKLRDDLQSTKQMLALELRNKEAQERENKRLLSKIQQLEAELEREKEKGPSDSSSSTKASSAANDTLIDSLKKDAEEAQKTSKLLEKKYEEAAEKLDTAKSEIEEQKRQIANLEKKLTAQDNNNVPTHQVSFHSIWSDEEPEVNYTFNCWKKPQPLKGSVGGISRRQSEVGGKESSPELEPELSESDDNDDEEKKAERKNKRMAREVKLLRNKLNKTKDKEVAAKNERQALREALKKNQVTLKEENKKFKKLQKEVDKMACLMNDQDDEDDEEKEENDDEKEAKDEEAESADSDSEDSESEDSDSGSESESESEDEGASNDDIKANLEPRIKWHEDRLAALKKGNYLLQASVDRIQDEINGIRDKSAQMQKDLDTLLSELG